MNNRAGRRFLSSAYLSVIQRRSYRSIDLIFLPFMCHLRFLEISLVLGEGSERDFKILSFLIRSLSISLASPEHLEFIILFCNCIPYSPYALDDNLRKVWNPLDSITIHPTSSRLQRVDIYINYRFVYGVAEGPDENELSKAVLDGLPLLRTKGILHVKAVSDG